MAAARSIDPAETARADVLYRALDSCQRQLYMAGRRAEGLAVRAEMLAIGRAQAEVTGHSEVRGLEDWAAGLSEEGRYAEAADVMTELVTAMLPRGRRSGALAWSLLEWIAALHDAGRSGEALAAFETLVGMEAAEAANDNGPMACHLHSLIGYARMLDTHGRGEQAAHVRQDALALLTGLAVTGERNSWSGYQASFWAVLLTMRSHCPLRRLLGAPHFVERVGFLFDDGVGLARRLSQHDRVEGPRTLARTLIDRSRASRDREPGHAGLPGKREVPGSADGALPGMMSDQDCVAP